MYIWCESCATRESLQDKCDEGFMYDYYTIKMHNIFSLQQDNRQP